MIITDLCVFTVGSAGGLTLSELHPGVTLDEVREQGGNLNLAGYVTKPDDTEIPTVAEATAALKEALEAAWAAEDDLNRLLAERGIA